MSVGLGLQLWIVVQRESLGLQRRCNASLRLLDNVRQLVADQRLATLAAWIPSTNARRSAVSPPSG